MSLPEFPGGDPSRTRDEVINQIISSIAMEELGLSHIINAEGEKLQYAMGTIPGISGPAVPATIDELLKLNKSIKDTLDSTVQNQMLLKSKLLGALSAAVTQGPPGLEGPRGPQGEQGIQGIAGTVGTIKGSFQTEQELRDAHPDGGEPGDFFYIKPNLWVWDEDNKDWVNVGEIAGPQGLQGIQGVKGDAGGVGPKGDTGAIGQRGPTGSTGSTGSTGLNGKSAYEIAVEKGFKGSEIEWLDSLKASSVTIIPFASQQAPYVGTNASGRPVNAALLGFGYLGLNTGIGGENAHVAVPIDPSDSSFNLGRSGYADRQTAFSLPYDMKLNNIYITTGNWEAFSVLIPRGTVVFPYVQIYTAPAGTNSFSPLVGAVAKPAEGLRPESSPAATMLKADVSRLGITITAGTRIAICGMMEITGDSAPRNYYLYYTGGIGFSN